MVQEEGFGAEVVDHLGDSRVRIEGGRIPTPAFFTVASIATALGLSLDDLLLRVDSAEEPVPAPLAV